MFLSSRTLKLSLSILALSALALAGISSRWTDLLATSTPAEAASVETVTPAPMTVGTCNTAGPIEVESTGGTTAPTAYGSLGAAFAAINAGTHTSSIAVEVCGNTDEGTTTAMLSASGTGSASYTDISIKPAGGSARTISGATTAGSPMIDLNGADNVTIDGLNAGGNSLTIANTTVSATSGTATIRFIGGATNNTITNSNIQGSGTMSVATNGATIFFSTDANTTNGNDNNTISNNNIGPAGANLPTKAILCNGSTGTTAIGNSGNIVNNNNIFDFFGAAVTSSGIASNGGCNTWMITNNRLYQTGTRTWTTGSLHTGIDIRPTTATSGAQGFTITGNTIGYASNNQTGIYTLTGAGAGAKFVGILFNGISSGATTNINNNTVAAVSMTGVTSSGTSTSSPFIGIIFQEGNGITNGNTIGSQSATGSLTFSTTTTSSTDVYGIYNFSSNAWTSNNNNVGGISVTNLGASGTVLVFGMRAFTASTTPWTATGNNIGGTVANSIQLNGTGTSSQVVGMFTSNCPMVLTSNTIRNLTSNIGTGTGTTASVAGILNSSTTPNSTLSQNTIFNLSNSNATAASTVTGIQFTGATANLVERNKIYALSVASNSVTAEISGIRVGGGTTIYRNNIIAVGAGTDNAIGGAATNSGTVGINGINETGGTNSFFHNSVYIGGSPNAGSGSSYCFNGSVSTTNVRSYRDNIFFNARSNSGIATGKNYAVKINGTAANPAGLTTNNNIFFANGSGGTFGFFNSLDVANLSGWKSAAGQDANSFEANPQFMDPANSTPDLHLSALASTVAEGNGADVGVIDDFDGQARASLTPVDIGADAGNFMGVDLSAPSISYIALGNTAQTTNRTLSATITDQTAVAGGGLAPRIYFNKNGGSYLSTGCSLNSGNSQNGVWLCTIDNSLLGGVTTADIIRYFMVAQDTAGNLGANPGGGFVGTDVNTVTTPPTTPNQYTIVQAISGSFNVGSGETYTSLSNSDAGGIFQALNAGVLTGNVVINITSDLTGETGTVALNEFSVDGVGGYTLTIKPSGAARTITGSSTNSIIRLNGADNVTIDGSLMGGSAAGVGGDATLRNLTIQNTSTTATAGAVIAVMQGPNSANNVTIKNVNVSGQDPTQTLIGIHVGGNTVGASPTTSSNNNLVIDNCAFKRSFIAIFDNGASVAAAATGGMITHNDISATGIDRMRRAGIFFFNQNGILVQENAIGGIVADESADAIGIIAGVQNVSTTATTSGGVFNAIIAKNRISGVSSANTTGFSAVGIALAGDPAGDNFIGNNMISGVSAPSTSPDIVAGIFVAGVPAASTHLYFNTVALTGDRGSVASQIGSYGLAVSGTNPTLELKDNIFYNTQTSGGGANAKSYAVGMNSSAFTNLASNYNDFFTSGANAAGFRTGSLDTTGTDIASISGWQAATAGDANSIALDPTFISAANNPHIPPTSPVVNIGTTIAAIHDDIDSQQRDAQPDIGADEVLPGTIQFSSATYTVGEAGPSIALTVKRVGGTDGAVSVDYATGGGTATGGASCGGAVDYVSASGTFNFANGDGADKTITVPICNDAVFEGNETLNATLSNVAGGATLGSPSVATVTITDNEAVPTIQFSSDTYSTVETLSGLTPEGIPGANITITLSGASQTATTVHYATNNGTATGGASCSAGVDYISASGTATILAGQTSTSFVVPICQDSVFEGDETVNLLLSSPSGATLGTPNFAVLTITDNDSASPIVVTATAGTTGPTGYTTLKDAVDAINAGTHQGVIMVGISTNLVEANAPIVLNGSGAGSASYTSILIQPIANGVTVSGATPTGRGLIELNGADNVTIDGDNPNSAGIHRDLTLQNTAANTVTFTSVVRLALATTVVTSTDNVVIKDLNIVGSATGRNVATAITTTGSENTTFGIFAGPGASTVSNTTAPAAVTSVSTSIGSGATASELTISNNSVTTAARAISLNGSATTVFPNLQISGNQIGNPTAGSADQVYAVGITAQGSPNGIISGNTVWVEGYIPSSAATQGINVGVNSASGAFTIDSNFVNRVQNNNGQTWSAFGINLGGSNGHVVKNNFISGVINNQTAGTGAFGSTFGAYGIRIASGTGHKVYHNSVNLYGAMPGATNTNLTSAFIMTATSQTGVDVRNNIFSNQITGGAPTGTRNAVISLPSGGTSTMNLTLNNNAYFGSSDALSRLAQAGTTLGTGEYLASDFDPTQTTPAANFRSYSSTLSAAGTNDNASFATSSVPPFTSNTDLHIPAATATRLESGGAAVGVTVDIDADSRNATTPDIGADEFAGQPAAANDIAASTFVVPANGSTIPTGSNFSPQAKFTNNGTATQTSVTVRFKIVDSSMARIYNQTATIASIAPLQSVTVTFPSTAIASPGAYTMQASSELAGDSVPANDSISGSFNTVSPVGGTITVGSGGNYTSLTNPGGLFETLNLAGISGNLTVNITSDLTTETGAVALNQLAEAGVGGYTVTIKPSGAARVISGTSAATSGLIILNGADRIVIDGSLSGGNDRSLTITNNQATTGVVIWMRSSSASNGATNNTVKNCIINGAPGPNSTTVAGILTGSGTTLGNDAEAPNNNNTIQNNWIYRVQNSMYLRGGTTAAVFDQNWVVTGNELGSSNGNDKNIFRGMLIGNSQNFTITNNFVHGVQSTGTTTAAMSGIQIALLVNGGTITRNIVSDIKNVSGTGTGAYGVQISSTSTASNVTIANNFISDVATAGSATVNSNGFGMMFNGSGTGYNVYFNSINMNTNQTSAQTSAAVNVNSTFATAGALNFRNNIFANTQTTGARYSVYITAAASVFTAIDYNDYFAQNVGFIGGSARTTLPDWQTATGGDANSKSVDPLFVSSSDLHLQAGSPMRSMAISGTGITTDIDGDTRDANPDIGADELPFVAVPGTLKFSSATYSIGEGGGMATITVTRTGGSDGAVSVNFATSDGTATGGGSCGGSVDYVNTSGILNWADGDSANKTFTVPICNDLIPEANETVNLALSNAGGGATIGSPSAAVLTITNDDVPGTLSVNDVRVWEGNSGTVNATFTVSYVGNAIPVSVQYATANGTAIAGSDYVQKTGTLVFNAPPPVTELGGLPTQTQTVTVQVVGDTNKEENETFFLNLSNPVNATIADSKGVGIINDDDRTFVSDFDHDLTTDLSVYRPSEGRWYVLQTTNATPKVVPFGNADDRPVPGDYDGDGYVDYAVWRTTTGTWFIQSSRDSSVTTVDWGLPGDKPVQGDYDGDGKTDIAVFRPSTGYWWFILSSNGSRPAFQFGLSSDRPVQADYDGDAKTDVAVYRDGVWYIARSRDGQVQISSFGLPTDRPVTGDFDGDGSYDIAVYRDGDWWISNSLTGTFTTLHWGLAGDIPVPADYDNDGITDITVFRPSNGDWYILKSTTNSLVEVHWGASGDIPIPSAYLPQ